MAVIYGIIRSMKLVQKELEIVKKRLIKNFIDPFPDESLKSFLSNGSKLIRSTLAILYLKSQNDLINDNVYKILSAGELIHNASLLHDDVIDDAEFRRGNFTINQKYSSNLAILSGDYLLAYAIEILLELKNFEILEKFQDCTKKMSKAEIDQYFLRGKCPSEEEYLAICSGKTASLFSVILESCAIISGMDAVNARNFGEIFGMCFQVKNDLDKDSAIIDKKNAILTAEDVLGIEKTQNLLDNYKEEMKNIIKDFQKNLYKEGLEDLINSL